MTFIPISALLGDNVVERSEAMPWYQGPPLLYHLEHVHIASDRNLIDVRFPVQWVIRPPASSVADYRAYAGQVAGGIMRAGRRGGRAAERAAHARSPRIDTFEGPVQEAFPPMSVALRLADDIDVGRGSTIVRTQNQPTVSSSFECLLCWMSEQPLSPRRRYLVKHTTRTAMVGGGRRALPDRRRDPASRRGRATTLELNDLARVHLRAELAAGVRLLPAQPRDRQPDRDRRGDQRNGRGRRDPRHRGRGAQPTEAKSERSPNVRWQGTRMTRERRWEPLGHGGATLWFTGLPGAGKSTVAAAVEERLIEAGQPAFLLDGDNLRHGLNGDLGFDEGARSENVRRTAHVAQAARRVGHDRAREPGQPVRGRPRGRGRAARGRRAATSSRSSSMRRSSCASSATRRACTRARARASWRA